jgi:predicted enzyme related to lactoylglutathione lyase
MYNDVMDVMLGMMARAEDLQRAADMRRIRQAKLAGKPPTDTMSARAVAWTDGVARERRHHMIKGLRTSTVWSEDLNNLLRFYRDTLGLTVGIEAPGFVLLGDPTGAAVALGTHSEVHGKAKEPQRHIIGLETDDIRGDYERLRKAGVEFLEEPVDGGQVIFATFKDPEGNYLQLLQYNSPT